MTRETTGTGSSNFAKTCNRFSQFLKERRSVGDIGFNGVIPPKLKIEGNNNNVNLKEKKSLDLFPLTSSSPSILNVEESNNNMVFSRENLKSNEEATNTSKGSMTIIYDGKVIVYDGLQEEMAQEIMSLAIQSVVTSTTQHDTSRHDTNMITRLSDIPIARGASLHRFMEKRKHRIATNAPYQQVNNSSSRKQLYKQQEEHQLELKLW